MIKILTSTTRNTDIDMTRLAGKIQELSEVREGLVKAYRDQKRPNLTKVKNKNFKKKVNSTVILKANKKINWCHWIKIKSWIWGKIYVHHHLFLVFQAEKHVKIRQLISLSGKWIKLGMLISLLRGLRKVNKSMSLCKILKGNWKSKSESYSEKTTASANKLCMTYITNYKTKSMNFLSKISKDHFQKCQFLTYLQLLNRHRRFSANLNRDFLSQRPQLPSLLPQLPNPLQCSRRLLKRQNKI